MAKKTAKKGAGWGGRRDNQTGRPPLPEGEKKDVKKVGYSLSPATVERIGQLAKETGMSKSEVVEAAVEEFNPKTAR